MRRISLAAIALAFTLAACHGEKTVEDVKKFGATLTAAGKLADIKVYDAAGHAFMNPNNKEGYDAAAAQDAWSRIDRFLDQTLRAKIPNS